jgi:hypothetical protein
MAAKKLNLVFRQGETFLRVIRWETKPFIYKPITAISKAAPVAITATGHGLKTGWRAAVVSVQGMTEINAPNSPPRDSDYHLVTATSNDIVSLNEVNSSEYSTYTSGGYLQYYTPVDLAGYSARMTVKNKVGGTVLLSLTSGLPDNRIAIDNTEHTITLTVSAADTDDLTFAAGVYDLEMVSPTGAVTTIFYGSVTVTKEVTAP